jgi:hypothetical protein
MREDRSVFIYYSFNRRLLPEKIVFMSIQKEPRENKLYC